MSDREKPFTVSDRRHFTPEGQPRTEPAQPSPAPAETADEAAPPREEPAPPREGPTAPREGPTAPRTTAKAPEKADFSAFVISLAGQAMALLAGEGLAEDTSPAEALEGARSIIAILEMLKDKTEGRRTAAEDEALERLLFELRMGYVARAKVSGA
jgi:Domain of unknown function (DUF1844)